MIFYAIQQKSTGYFLPNPPTHRGATWVEPTKSATPRLYGREQDAECSLKYYLAGKSTMHWAKDWETGLPEPRGPRTQKGTERDKNDFHVIRFSLKLLKYKV